jgi:phenylacetate-CoA ligase
VLDFLNRHVALPLVAKRRKSRHLDYMRFLDRTQFDPPDLVRARQLAMLKATLRHAWDTVPYYRATWQAAGVHPADVKTLGDLSHFPVVTKTDVRTRGDTLVSTAYDRSKLRVKKTSGSTGVPLSVRIDEPAVQWKYACTLRADQWSGYRLGQRVAKVWGNPEYRHFGLKGRVMNHVVDRAVYLDTIHLTGERIREFTDRLRRHRPGLIFGHAHSLYLVACELKKAGVRDVRPGGVISTAMPLHDWQRAVIDEVFGVPATNRYGCEEVSLIASECERHDGLHVAAESVYTEVEPSGHLLVTDLSNYAMPLIRYRVGDVVTVSDDPCPCGRGLPLLGKVMGRDADYVVTPAGSLISGISLTENFAVLVGGVAQMQLVQEEVTFLRVRMVPDDTFTAASRGQIAKLVADTFGPKMRHEVELVDAIPQDPSGKYRFCVSKVAADHVRGLSA